MVPTFLNFVLGTAATAGTATAISSLDPNNFTNLGDLLKYIISIVGGILATIIINLLKKKFPDWFNNQKKVSK
jgi:hypothetical protein